MDMNKRSYFLVVATVIVAVVITLFLRKSSYGNEKMEVRLPSENSFPLKNVANDGYSLTQGKRGKGIGSKDINGRRQQEEDERQRQIFSSRKQTNQYPDVELPLTSNPRTEKMAPPRQQTDADDVHQGNSEHE
ncbi:uncharacterized protein LOC135689144 isoform X2 [Rhopilema esculentum]|uniref:uncharacterized protein LOC135689144 isoform X2 n=1 Tax=Rhopilema esculentum TaxID=499914 RepID=UPI0031D24AD6